MNLCVTFNLECAHRLEQPIGVPRLHGHSYIVKVCVESSPDNPEPLPAIQGWADQLQHRLDHGYLNDVIPQPTMEAIAAYIRDNWQGPSLSAVTVSRPTLGASAEWTA